MQVILNGVLYGGKPVMLLSLNVAPSLKPDAYILIWSHLYGPIWYYYTGHSTQIYLYILHLAWCVLKVE